MPKSRNNSYKGIEPDFLTAVSHIQTNAPFLDSLVQIYSQADEEISKLFPVCSCCGKCCQFDLAGHKLYVSTGELAFLSKVPPSPDVQMQVGRCPYQSGQQCFVRDRRPLGCRVFFCRQAIKNGFQSIYERYHQKIRQLHQSYSLSYGYAEMTNLLTQFFDSK